MIYYDESCIKFIRGQTNLININRILKNSEHFKLYPYIAQKSKHILEIIPFLTVYFLIHQIDLIFHEKNPMKLFTDRKTKRNSRYSCRLNIKHYTSSKCYQCNNMVRQIKNNRFKFFIVLTFVYTAKCCRIKYCLFSCYLGCTIVPKDRTI